ncbi:nucleotidyltransferase domain-containing protein [Nodosilinea sp. AN01ver1]|uniref:nucleotidyltransferase domain-containing protein n=1 Tax=Nodosilinea sp. AN01ver1 TaxID=3423362 RepID=UPI003D311F1C
MVDMQQIEALSQQIAEQFNPDRIILFGSYAYGEPTADSDVDLLVVLPFEGYPARKAAEIRCQVRPGFALDLLVRTPEYLTQRLTMQDFFLEDIVNNGKVLYDSNITGVD